VTSRPIRVLIVDDSAFIRQVLTEMLSRDPEIEVVGTAPHPLIARERIKELNPDVMTLDVEMPHMDGITFLEKVMRLRPMPVVMVSSLTQEGADTTLRALELGAVDAIGKPTENLWDNMAGLGDQIVAKVKMAARARVRSAAQRLTAVPRPVMTADPAPRRGPTRRTIVAIGASTGGVNALPEVMRGLPDDLPPVVITQHMPPGFTRGFAERLGRISSLAIAEAEDGMRLANGHAYLAPGDRHLLLGRDPRGALVCRLSDEMPVSGHRPSVDMMFRSVAKVAGASAIGVIMTGMGRDGADGLKEMHDLGAHTIAQDESTCIVHGMPKAATMLGAVDRQTPLTGIAGAIVEAL
jgi:two-component system chemotaxis response regulator CheB